MGIRARALVLSLACLAFSPCEVPEDEPPGDVVGTFDVLGLVAAHTCGDSAIPITDGRILAEVWREDSDAFWQTQAGPLVAGIIIDDQYRFHEPQTLTLTPADPRTRVNACVVSRTDTLTFRLTESVVDAMMGDAGVNSDGSETEGAETDTVMKLSGTNTIEFAPLAGSDCRFAIVSGGGVFAALPCRVEYTLSGERVDAL